MNQSYHYGRFEFFVVATVIAIIAIAAISRYSFMAEGARILRLEIISHHFMTGAANMRVQFFLVNATNGVNVKSLEINDQTLFFSPQGWPVSLKDSISSHYQPTDEDCYQLWQLLLQNPAPIIKGSTIEARKEFRAFSQPNSCRYQFSDGSSYFDYYPLDGGLVFTHQGEGGQD